MTDRRDLLRMLANSPDGCTEAVLMAHGFDLSFLARLVVDGLATAETWPVRAGALTVDVTRLRITKAGRRELAGSDDFWAP